MRIVIEVDGASRGNPGASACGIVLRIEGGQEREVGLYLGNTTNNVAEYLAVIAGLQLAREEGAREIRLQTDSELLVKQLSGAYRVRAEHLRPLYQKAMRLLGQFDKTHVTHVPRQNNRRADRLANLALDTASQIPC